ncbi:hypothetical protein PG999_014726 [Apiospora kogelbergensis]|uniref:Cyanovirin-N domain-containing protein n=1 Tax=Apiospora kogelbergensis TaxID=1337665 RepID=A0AAW0QAW4_9PEZI
MDNCYAWDAKEGIYEKDGGRLSDHCEGCEIDDDGHTMRCQCHEGNKENMSYYIDTDNLIGNDEGYLSCYGYKGTKCQPDKVAALGGSSGGDPRRSLAFTA